MDQASEISGSKGAKGSSGGGIDVLHVIPSLSIGGAENMLAALASAPRERPMRQAVAQIFRDDALAGPIRAAGVPVYSADARTMVQVPVAVVRLARLIRRLQPRVIQSWVHYADLLSLLALEVSGRRSATRLYWGVRCSYVDFSQYSRTYYWAVRACAALSRWPDAVVANSFAGREMHRQLGYSPRAFFVVPNGIDTDRFVPDGEVRARLRRDFALDDAAFVVVHVARTDPLKDHALLLAVAAAMPNVHFIAVGAGTEALANPANLRCVGLRRDVPKILAMADAFVLTSRGEGFPNVLAEAMSAGLPVVTTDVGDARRIVGDAGAVVPPGDRDAMVLAVGELLRAGPDLRREQGRRARQRIVDQFSLRACVSSFDALHLHGVAPCEPGDRVRDQSEPVQAISG